MQENFDNVVCDAEESDWLEVSYTQRKYIEPTKKRKWNLRFNLSKKARVVAVVLACVAVLGAFLLIDGDFSKEVFATVKTAYSSVLNIFSQPTPTNNTITLPVNVNLMDSAEGVSTFGGGKAVLSFTNGTVQSVEENAITVAIDQDTTITYTGITSPFVAVGDAITTNTLLGKYDKTFQTVIAQKGEVITQVVASETQLTWQI